MATNQVQITQALILTIAARCNARLQFGDAARAQETLTDGERQFLLDFNPSPEIVKSVIEENREGILSAVFNHTSANWSLIQEMGRDVFEL